MAISNSLTITYSMNGVPVYGTDFPKLAVKRQLTAGEKVSTVVPGGVDQVLITTSSGSNIQVSPTNEDLPASGSWQNTNAFMNKPVLNVSPGDTLYFVSPTDDILYLAFFSSGKLL